ncbi:MAG: lipocalin-like domain-containing protein [Pseudomonadota bacterium]
MPHSTEDFVGAWSLVDWRIEYSDGAITHPFGKVAHGYIVYAANGIMVANIAKGARDPFGMPNARNAGADQKAGAFDSYFAYAGPWRIEGDEVVHAVAMSLFPDMTGTEQRRLAVFDGNGGLTLSAHEAMKDGASRHHVLQWQREGA